MNCESRILKLKKFPLEAEAIAAMAQHELASLSREELLAYSQQTVLVMSQLRHYCTELIQAVEHLGFTVDGSEG